MAKNFHYQKKIISKKIVCKNFHLKQKLSSTKKINQKKIIIKISFKVNLMKAEKNRKNAPEYFFFNFYINPRQKLIF